MVKKIFSLLLLAMTMLVSCGKDPEAGDNEDDNKAGTVTTSGYTIGGEPIESWRIIYDNSDGESNVRTAALDLRTAFKTYISTEVQVYSKSSKEAAYEILVGDCGREVNSSYSGVTGESFAACEDPFAWIVSLRENKLIIEGASTWGVIGAARSLVDNYISKKKAIPDGFSLSGDCRNTALFDRPEGTNLRLLTYNIWAYDKTAIPSAFYGDGNLLYDPTNSNRSKDFAAVIRCTAPDVFALQEYTSAMNTLFEPLVAPEYVRCTTADSQWNWTPLYYNSQTVTLKSVEYQVFDAAWSNSYSKSFTIATFTHKGTGKDFVVAGTHLWWKSESSQAGSDNARLEQAKLIMTKAGTIVADNNVPVFVMGDLNCKYSSTAIQAFISGGYSEASRDASVKKDGSMGYHSCSDSGFANETDAQKADNNGETAIDHILFGNCDSKAQIKYYTIVHTPFTFPMSDHAPRYMDATLL